jgi:NAD+ synthase (glutamine-hydrolysing)
VTGGITAVVGMAAAAGSVVYNAASVLRDGRIDATYRKRELPNYAVFDERRYFACQSTRGGAACSRSPACAVGLLICEDLWHAEPLADRAAGAQLVLVPTPRPSSATSWPSAMRCWRSASARERRRHRLPQLVGGQDALVFDGASQLADGDGACIRPRRVRADQWLVADFDAAKRRFARAVAEDGDESARRAGLARWCAAPATTAQERFRRPGWACPAASIRRWCWRSRSMRWAPTTSPPCACPRATPPT